jgi:uncharacterized metal-binding protein YceD (DUF177 family)
MSMSKSHKTKKQTREEQLLPVFSRVLRVDDIEDGEDYSVEASKSERDAIASLLDLVALAAFRFAGRFHFAGEKRLLLEGTLAARPTQTCAVSLEPVESTIEAPVKIEFWPEARIDALAETADEATSHGILDWPEPIVDGKIELGPFLYETLATSLDPYPRREGARFEWREPPEEAEAPVKADSPFAALSKLKEG